jgi:hypothetical protein
MHSKTWKAFKARPREFSHRTALWAVLFVATLTIAAVVDLDGLLVYFKLLPGSPFMTLETGAAILMACAIPFLGMGMSISADTKK